MLFGFPQKASSTKVNNGRSENCSLRGLWGSNVLLWKRDHLKRVNNAASLLETIEFMSIGDDASDKPFYVIAAAWQTKRPRARIFEGVVRIYSSETWFNPQIIAIVLCGLRSDDTTMLWNGWVWNPINLKNKVSIVR